MEGFIQIIKYPIFTHVHCEKQKKLATCNIGSLSHKKLTPIPILMNIQITMLIILVAMVHPLMWPSIVIIASFVNDTIIDTNANVN